MASKPSNQEYKSDFSEFPLLQAVYEDRTDSVREILLSDAGKISVNRQSWAHGVTALHQAVWNGNYEIIKMLLIAGGKYSIYVMDHRGFTPFRLAVIRDDLQVVELLCISARSIAPELLRCAGENKLFGMRMAIDRSDVEMIRILILSGCSIVATSMSGKTALHVAAATNDLALVNCLIRKGADVNSKDNECRTALHYATIKSKNNSHLGVIQVLLRSYADFNCIDAYNKSVCVYLNRNKYENNNVKKIFLDYSKNI